MAIAYLAHTPIGKATQAQPYTAAAHLRYITRRNATDYVYSERMPVQYHAAQRYLMEREDSIRKNGRVCDKLIIALPREMTMEQSVDALRDFGFRLSKGEAPFLFSIQDFDLDNPHAHFVFVDADGDGKRVFRTSDRDSTERIKAIWQDTCNEHLQELGVEKAIQFGQPEIANDNAVEHSTEEPQRQFDIEQAETVEPAAPICAETQVEPEPEPDLPLSEDEIGSDEMDGVIESGALENHERIKAALDANFEREILREERAELARLHEQVRAAEQAALDRHTDFNIAAYEQAKAGMVADAARDQLDRMPRGYHLQVGRFEWKSRSRKNHEAALVVRNAAEFRLRNAISRTAEENIEAGRAARYAIELDQKRHKLEFHLRTRGTAQELDDADKLFESTIAANMKGVSVHTVVAEMDAGRLSHEQARQALAMMGEESVFWQIEERDGFEPREGIDI